MANNIWIVIADSEKAKVVSYEHPIYKTQPKQNTSRGEDQYVSDNQFSDQTQASNERYEYRVIQQFEAMQDEEPWATFQESGLNGDELEEPPRITLEMRKDPGIAAISVKLSRYLQWAKASGKFDCIILVASKDVLAIVKSALTMELQELVTMELETEFIDIDPETLRANLPANV